MNVSVELAGAVQAVLRLRRVHPIYPPYGYLHRRITSLVARASVAYAQSTGRGSQRHVHFEMYACGEKDRVRNRKYDTPALTRMSRWINALDALDA